MVGADAELYVKPAKEAAPPGVVTITVPVEPTPTTAVISLAVTTV
jgi:hypothetical protein